MARGGRRSLVEVVGLVAVFALFVAAVILAAGCGKVSKSDEGDGGAEDVGDPGDAADDEGDDDGDDPDDGAEDVGDDVDDSDGDGDGDGAGTPLSCEYQAGDRLAPSIRQHDDGTSEVVGLFDGELGFDCSFEPAADGQIRCMPVPDGGQMPTFRPYFSDAGCTTRLARIDRDEVAATPRFANEELDDSAPGCAPHRRFVELGAERTMPAGSLVYDFQDGFGCFGVASEPDVYRHFDVGAELASEQFVAGAERFTEGGRLSVRVVDGADGSRSCRGEVFRDAELDGHPCSPQRDEDGQLRCLPQAPPVSGTVATTAACADALLVSQVPASCDQGIDYVRRPPSGHCFSRAATYVRGPEHDGALFFRFSPDFCVPLPTGYRYHDIGPRVPSSALAGLEQRFVSTGSRLERAEVEGEGIHMPRPLWRDTELDAVCEFERATDGVIRCLPGPTADYFDSLIDPIRGTAQALVIAVHPPGDADCSGTTIQAAIYQDGACEPGAAPRFAVERTFRGQGVFEVGQRLTGSYRTRNGECRPLPDGTHVYALGAEIAPTTFVAGAAAADPPGRVPGLAAAGSPTPLRRR